MGIESDMVSAFVVIELIDYVGVLFLGDRIKWNVMIHRKRQNIFLRSGRETNLLKATLSICFT